MRDPVTAYVALGANLGDARAAVLQAFEALARWPGIQVTGRSALYRTAPYEAQGPDFINAVARIDTRLTAPDVLDAPRKETHSTDFQMGHHAPITEKTAREDVGREKASGQRLFGRRLKHNGDLMLLDGIEVDQAYLDELAFYEEPITIVINPSTHKNAASIFENWSNGIGAEMLINDKWLIIKDLPVGKPITIKRKIVEQIVRARVMGVQTIHEEPPVPSPRNEIIRTASHVHSFSILKDSSPKSEEWLTLAYSRPI